MGNKPGQCLCGSTLCPAPEHLPCVLLLNLHAVSCRWCPAQHPRQPAACQEGRQGQGWIHEPRVLIALRFKRKPCCWVSCSWLGCSTGYLVLLLPFVCCCRGDGKFLLPQVWVVQGFVLSLSRCAVRISHSVLSGVAVYIADSRCNTFHWKRCLWSAGCWLGAMKHGVDHCCWVWQAAEYT